MSHRNSHAPRFVVALVGFVSLLGGCAVDTSATLPPVANDAASPDARSGDSAPRDSGPLPTDSAMRPPPDAPPDTGPDVDSGVDGGADAGVDSGPGDVRCPVLAADVVALYTFEGISGATTTPDVIDGHVGEVQNGTASGWSGPLGCGDALRLPSGARNYVTVRDSPAWDLPTGSVDFWFIRRAGAPTPAGLVGRDAMNQVFPGHFRIAIETDGRLLVRIQDGDDSYELNQPDPTRGEWHHVGANWGGGGLELWYDGVRVAADEDVAVGIDGNHNAWVIGADPQSVQEGSYPPVGVSRVSTHTGIDHVRISELRRDFSSYAALAPVMP